MQGLIARRAEPRQTQHAHMAVQPRRSHGTAVAEFALRRDIGQMVRLVGLGYEGDIAVAPVDEGPHHLCRAKLVVMAAGVPVVPGRTQPGMTETSLAPEQARHAGHSFEELVSWLVEDASCNR